MPGWYWLIQRGQLVLSATTEMIISLRELVTASGNDYDLFLLNHGHFHRSRIDQHPEWY